MAAIIHVQENCECPERFGGSRCEHDLKPPVKRVTKTRVPDPEPENFLANMALVVMALLVFGPTLAILYVI